MTEILLRDKDEFFHVVFRIQLLFVKWLLADDAIEEVSVLRHAPARRNGQIAFRIDQSIAVGIDRCIEILRNQVFHLSVGNPNMVLRGNVPTTSSSIASSRSSSSSPSIWKGS